MTAPRVLAALAFGLVLGCAVALRHAPGDPDALARRLLLLNGHVDAPKIVERDEDSLYVVTGSGKFAFVLQPSCDERLPCRLGFSLLCWDATR